MPLVIFSNRLQYYFLRMKATMYFLKWWIHNINNKHCCIVDNCPTQLYRGCTAWTGLNDLDTEGQYVWDHSNTSVFFTNWHRIEPSLYNPPDAHTRDCVDMYRTGEWNDRPCSYENPFICEKINFWPLNKSKTRGSKIYEDIKIVFDKSIFRIKSKQRGETCSAF